jgi:hypothetical protein
MRYLFSVDGISPKISTVQPGRQGESAGPVRKRDPRTLHGAHSALAADIAKDFTV